MSFLGGGELMHRGSKTSKISILPTVWECRPLSPDNASKSKNNDLGSKALSINCVEAQLISLTQSKPYQKVLLQAFTQWRSSKAKREGSVKQISNEIYQKVPLVYRQLFSVQDLQEIMASAMMPPKGGNDRETIVNLFLAAVKKYDGSIKRRFGGSRESDIVRRRYKRSEYNPQHQRMTRPSECCVCYICFNNIVIPSVQVIAYNRRKSRLIDCIREEFNKQFENDSVFESIFKLEHTAAYCWGQGTYTLTDDCVEQFNRKRREASLRLKGGREGYHPYIVPSRHPFL